MTAERLDLILALWFTSAVCRRVEAEGVTPSVRQALAEGRREFERACDALGIDAAPAMPRLEAVEPGT